MTFHLFSSLRVSKRSLYLILLGLFVGLTSFGPVILMFIQSLFGSDGSFGLTAYFRAYSNPRLVQVILTSTYNAIGKSAISISIGAVLAVMVTRTNVPFKKLVSVIAVSQLFFPEFLNAVAWIFLAGPSGMINQYYMQVTGSTEPIVNIYSMAGLIWVEGVHSVPLTFLIISSALKSMDTSMEEASMITGSNMRSTFRHVTIPLAMPAIISVAILTMVHGFEAFSSPAIIGIPAGLRLFTSEMFYELATSPGEKLLDAYNYAAALSLVLMLITMVGIFFFRRYTRASYKFVTVTGRGYQPRVIDLGRWKYFAALVPLGVSLINFLPFAVIVLKAFAPPYASFGPDMITHANLQAFVNVFTQAEFRGDIETAAINTGLLVLIGPLAATTLSIVISYVVLRSRAGGAGTIESMAMLPLALPGFVFGLATLRAFIRTPLYGSFSLILLVLTVRYLPIGIRFTSPIVLQIGNELEESARVAGGSWLSTFRHIFLPLSAHGAVSTWSYMFTRYFQELSVVVLLGTSGAQVIAFMIFKLAEEGWWREVAALSVIYMAVASTVYLLASGLVERRLIRTRV